jgi:hypothetical protein
VTVAWIAPRSRKQVLGLRSGRYSVMLRDFFGQETVPAKPLDVPAHIVLGEPAKLPDHEPSRQ